ncbi:hypothetical protein N9C35_03770 [Flavobacteriaceae bacterium]|nr:hypothetical protein [Flavobacteriaceae bacterium]
MKIKKKIFFGSIIFLNLFFYKISYGDIIAKDFSYGLRASNYLYQEFVDDKQTAFMKLNGQAYGGDFSLTYNIEDFTDDEVLYKINVALDFSSLDYKGSYQSGNYGDLEMGGNSNSVFEIAFLSEANLENSSFFPYIGIAYRKLDNQLVGSGGYKRVSKYYYIPIGAKLDIYEDADLSANFSVQYNLFLKGEQFSGIGDGLTNEQNEGYGLRISFDIEHRLDNGDNFIIRPFYQFWEIEDSDAGYYTDSYGVQKSGLEPYNFTREIGVSFLMKMEL